MNILERQKLIAKDTFLSKGRDFTIQYSYFDNGFKISFFIDDLDLLKKYDYFEIDFYELKQYLDTGTVMSVENDTMELDNMSIVTATNGGKIRKSARMVYVANITKGKQAHSFSHLIISEPNVAVRTLSDHVSIMPFAMHDRQE